MDLRIQRNRLHRACAGEGQIFPAIVPGADRSSPAAPGRAGQTTDKVRPQAERQRPIRRQFVRPSTEVRWPSRLQISATSIRLPIAASLSLTFTQIKSLSGAHLKQFSGHASLKNLDEYVKLDE